jgi:uncharacterized protein DUF397
MTTNHRSYKKSSYSNDSATCVELAGTLDCVRDSKNPAIELPAKNLTLLVAELRSGSNRFIVR